MNDLMRIALAAVVCFSVLWIATGQLTKPREFEVTEEEIFWLLRQGQVVRYNHRKSKLYLYWFREEGEPKTVGMIKDYRSRVLN